DAGNAVALATNGYAVVAGSSSSTDLPATDAVQPLSAGGGDGFVAEFTTTGGAVPSATYVGGSAADVANGAALDSSGLAYPVGPPSSADFPVTVTTGAFQATLGGGSDAFVTRLPLPLLPAALVPPLAPYGGDPTDQEVATAAGAQAGDPGSGAFSATG